MKITPTRLARNLSAGVVASIAAWSSYQHMVAVALGVGERPDVAHVLPLSVDGMLVVASVAMVDDKKAGRRVRWSARVAFVAGVAASVGANVSAAHPTIGARVVAAWPALALLLTVELLSRAGKALPTKSTEPVVDVAPAVVDAPVVDEPEPVALVDAPKPRKAPPSSAPAIAKAAARTPNATPAEIAARVGVSERTVQRHLPKPQRRDDTVTTPRLAASVSPAPAGA